MDGEALDRVLLSVSSDCTILPAMCKKRDYELLRYSYVPCFVLSSKSVVLFTFNA